MSHVNLWAMFGGLAVSFAAISLVRFRFDGVRKTIFGVPGEEKEPKEKPTARALLLNAAVSIPVLFFLFAGPWYAATAAVVIVIAVYHFEFTKVAKTNGWLSNSTDDRRFVVSMMVLSILGLAFMFGAFLQARFT